MILCDESGVLAPTLASTGSKKNLRWRRVRRQTLPAATTPSLYASKLPRPNPPRGEQNCAEPSPRRRPSPFACTQKKPKENPTSFMIFWLYGPITFSLVLNYTVHTLGSSSRFFFLTFIFIFLQRNRGNLYGISKYHTICNVVLFLL